MITTMVSLSYFEKHCLLNLELAEGQIGQIFDRFLGGKLITEYFKRANFNCVFIDISNVKITFLNK